MEELPVPSFQASRQRWTRYLACVWSPCSNTSMSPLPARNWERFTSRPRQYQEHLGRQWASLWEYNKTLQKSKHAHFYPPYQKHWAWYPSHGTSLGGMDPSIQRHGTRAGQQPVDQLTIGWLHDNEQLKHSQQISWKPPEMKIFTISLEGRFITDCSNMKSRSVPPPPPQ